MSYVADVEEKAARRNKVEATYNMANLRGFAIMIGHSVKQMTKQASAPRLQPPKTRSRSHLLTVRQSS